MVIIEIRGLYICQNSKFCWMALNLFSLKVSNKSKSQTISFLDWELSFYSSSSHWMNNFLTPFSRSERQIQMRWKYSRKKLQYGSCLSTLIVGTFLCRSALKKKKCLALTNICRISRCYLKMQDEIFCKCFGQTYFWGKAWPQGIIARFKVVYRVSKALQGRKYDLFVIM